MMKSRIYSLMKKNNIFVENDVFDYGFSILVTYLKYLLFIIPFSILFKEFVEVFIFLIIFIPIRRFIGGFHFKNLKYCFIGSVLSVISLPYLAMRIYIPPVLVILIILSSVFLTICIGSVDHPNKPLTIYEKKKHTQKALFVEIIYVFIIIIMKDDSFIRNIILLVLIFCVGGLCISKYCR